MTHGLSGGWTLYWVVVITAVVTFALTAVFVSAALYDHLEQLESAVRACQGGA